MKTYRKPVVKEIDLKDELLLVVGGSTEDQDQFSKRNAIITDDEYPGGDISYSKGIFRGSEEISEDATIVNHY